MRVNEAQLRDVVVDEDLELRVAAPLAGAGKSMTRSTEAPLRSGNSGGSIILLRSSPWLLPDCKVRQDICGERPLVTPTSLILRSNGPRNSSILFQSFIRKTTNNPFESNTRNTSLQCRSYLITMMKHVFFNLVNFCKYKP